MLALLNLSAYAHNRCLLNVGNTTNQYNVKVMEDVAHAVPSTHNGQMIGTFDDRTVYSFMLIKQSLLVKEVWS